MPLEIDSDHLRNGILGLVLALVEVIRDALRIQAMKRVDSGLLSEEEVERLGQAFIELDSAIDEIKQQQGIVDSVKAVRDGLDDIVSEVVDKMVNPMRWQEE